ncbi:MAG: hypothetical protein ACI8PB_000883 [Desulforhopalus sp.]|jgi:hypothetical protein
MEDFDDPADLNGDDDGDGDGELDGIWETR